MKKALTLIVAGLFLVAGFNIAFAEKAPQKVIDLANGELAKVGTDPVIIKAVKAENAKGKTLDQIKEKDKKWKATAGIADYMKALMDSECGKHIANIQNSGKNL